MRLTPRKTAVAAAAFLSIIIFFVTYISSGSSQPNGRLKSSSIARKDLSTSLRESRRAKVVDAFEHAWNGYAKYCFGNDTIHPVGQTCGNELDGWGASVFDALSTAILLEKTDIVERTVSYITTVDFTKVKSGTKIQPFEITRRHLAGILSAYDLLAGPYSHLLDDKAISKSLYHQAIRLADVLSCSFKTPSGIPRDWVDPATCKADDGASTTIAAVGSFILEFSRLSDITGDPKYARLARRAQAHLLNPEPGHFEPWPGLIGSSVWTADGRIATGKGSWGALSDSFYSSLLLSSIYDLPEYSFYLERWLKTADSTIRYLTSHPHGQPSLTLLPSWDESTLFNKMDASTWSAGGNIILGGLHANNQTLVDFGLSIADAAAAVYHSTQTGLGGDSIIWTENCTNTKDWGPDCNETNSFRLADGQFKLRSEVLETWYYAYRATRDSKYREWIWQAFEAIEKYCRTEAGYSGLRDVNLEGGGERMDEAQDSSWLARGLKIVWLTHLEDAEGLLFATANKQGWVLSAQGHLLKVVNAG